MARTKQLYRKSRVVPDASRGNARAGKAVGIEQSQRGLEILWAAQQYWTDMYPFRRDRQRNKRYVFGRQWDDVISVDCKQMTEAEYIKSQGNIPLQNNMIRRLVRDVVGVYRKQSKEPVCISRDRSEQAIGETATTLLQYNAQLNHKTELYARAMEEYLISGLVVQRKWFGWLGKHRDCWSENLSPERFFIDTHMHDPRGWDVNFLGEIHDVTFDDLCNQLAHSKADYDRLSALYSPARRLSGRSLYRRTFGKDNGDAADFLYCMDESMCRVIEVWRKESKPRYRCWDTNTGELFKIEASEYQRAVSEENAYRLSEAARAGMPAEEVPLIESEWMVDSYWRYYLLTPGGEILEEGESPYQHGEHPYVFKAYPFIDGEIHSFVSDVIDQQRYVNRLVTLQDWVVRASAKGALLLPEESIPEGMSVEQFADEWSRFNGVIVYRAKPGVPMPQQVANNSTNIGIGELLNLQLKFFEDISGVHGALQGRPGASGMSASLYMQQAQNSTTSLLDVLDSFGEFVIDSTRKDLSNICQYYDARKIDAIVGEGNGEHLLATLQDSELDLSLSEGTSNPAYRMVANEFLMDVWRSGQISLTEMLKAGHFPYGDMLLQAIESRENTQAAPQEAAAAGQPQGGMPQQGIDPRLLQAAEQGASEADPRSVQLLYNALHGEEGGTA